MFMMPLINEFIKISTIFETEFPKDTNSDKEWKCTKDARSTDQWKHFPHINSLKEMQIFYAIKNIKTLLRDVFSMIF